MPAPTLVQRLVPLLVLGGALLALLPDVLLGRSILFCRDTANLFLPLWTWMGERLRAGELPLWFPYEGLGTPLVGIAVSGLFHPQALLITLLPAADALRLTALGAFALAFLSTWGLARRLELPAWAAAVAALSFTLCGSLTGLVNNPTYLCAGATFPLFLLGLHRALQGERVAGTCTASLAVALALLGGELQTAYLMGLTGGLYALGAFAPLHPRGLARALAWVAAPCALGLLLGAVQVLPALEAASYVERGTGLSWEESTLWSLHPLRLPELFLGDLVQWEPGAQTPNLVRRDLLGSEGLWSVTVTVGVAALLGSALVLALPGPRRRLELTLVALAVLLLLLALGEHSGLYRLAWHLLPVWASFRFPEKLALHAALPLSLLAALGLHRASEVGARAAGLRWRAVATSALVIGGLLLVAALAGVRLAAGEPGEAWRAYLAALARSALLSAALAATLAALALLRLPGRRGALLQGFALPALVLLQLWGVNARSVALCSAPRWVTEVESSPAEVLRRAEPGHERWRANPAFSYPGRIQPPPSLGEVSPWVQSSLWERQMLVPDHGALSGVEVYGRILPFIPRRLGLLRTTGDWNQWLPLYNTRYVITSQEDLPRLKGLSPQAVESLPELGAVVVRLPGALPRAYVAAPLRADSAQQALARMQAPEVLRGERVVVEGEVVEPAGPVQGSASITSWRPERVEVEVWLERAGVLVLNESFFPGWEAEVDGVRAPLWPANLLVRAVPVSAGRHRVVFYLPASVGLRMGAMASAVGLGIWLVLLTAAWRRGRSPAHRPQG